jgi:hypothetical protein
MLDFGYSITHSTFGHTVFFYQLFISLSTVCLTFQLLLSNPKLMYKVDNGFIHLLILLLQRYLKSYLFPLA